MFLKKKKQVVYRIENNEGIGPYVTDTYFSFRPEHNNILDKTHPNHLEDTFDKNRLRI